MHCLYGKLKAVAVIQMETHRHRYLLRLCFHDRRIGLNRSVFDRTGRGLKHNGCFQLLSRCEHRLDHLHVFDVERTYCVTVFLSI